jgi:tRNA nucleotidyltransferase (CCA-adding enzyme)
MRLILTHEQSDFDGLASLLGAYLMDIECIPVLPRKLNRNVRSFLTIYGADLPFVDARDLPHGQVDEVTLVDTQSLITIKGMDKKTIIRVIDHHPQKKDLPENWKVTLTETGSTVTFLTELISEENNSLSIVHATLLLLGIYEDTGSLTYQCTTGRDGRAVAFLLDQGADLQIAENFLNPSLSPEQRMFYDRLSGNAKILNISGHRIVITCGKMEEFNDEISSLAHKLRDYFDPDGLFVIVSTSEGIRLVARSTTDDIDVSSIAAHFGGGGHERAAAALIRVSDMKNDQAESDKVYDQLLEILPDYIRPNITVSQIMSGSPHVISPDTTVVEASQLMQYYGYEGYPVVDNGKVIGLLTRRVVDKALNHKLNLTAESLMDANEVWVRPDDSIQLLQARMTDSGWGQIPVVDPTSGQMVGIVTRTDLLKMLSPKSSRRNRENLEARLIQALAPDRMVIIRLLAKEADEHKTPIFVVGGFVRDLILDRPGMDFDIVVEGDAIVFAKKVAAKYGGRVTIHNRFGTAKWYLAGSTFKGKTIPDFLDFITARMEFYSHPTALPTVERSSIKLDLHRRDFTINALALRLDGKHFGDLFDYWGGGNDLREQLIRVLHSLSFVDDPTRMLRAIRFEQRFDFKIEDRTMQLLLDARSLLNNLSGDRIRHELILIMEEEKCAKILARLADLGLLSAIHPALPWNEGIYSEITGNIWRQPPATWGKTKELNLFSERKYQGFLIWLSHSLDQDVNEICDRLKLSDLMKKTIQGIQKITKKMPELDDVPPSITFQELEPFSMTALFVAFLQVNPSEQKLIETYVVTWKNMKPNTTGDDLRKRGLKPGPTYQNILQRLRKAWLDGEIITTEEEMILLGEILGELQKPSPD